MDTELYMTPALAELWLRNSSPAEMQEWTDHCLPSEDLASTADVVARLHTTADDCRTGGINVDDAIVTFSDFGRTNTFVLRLYVAHILRGLAICAPRWPDRCHASASVGFRRRFCYMLCDIGGSLSPWHGRAATYGQMLGVQPWWRKARRLLVPR